jgi:hypothetical protein
MTLSTHLINTTPPSSQPTCPTDSTESGNNYASDGIQAIVVDDSDEGSSEGNMTDKDDNAKLDM